MTIDSVTSFHPLYMVRMCVCQVAVQVWRGRCGRFTATCRHCRTTSAADAGAAACRRYCRPSPPPPPPPANTMARQPAHRTTQVRRVTTSNVLSKHRIFETKTFLCFRCTVPSITAASWTYENFNMLRLCLDNNNNRA